MGFILDVEQGVMGIGPSHKAVNSHVKIYRLFLMWTSQPLNMRPVSFGRQ